MSELQSIYTHTTKTWGALDKEYASFKSHHRDLSNYMLPRRGRFQVDERATRGSKKQKYILNGTATYAVRALSAGMMAGLTSPARPWVKLITRDPGLREFKAVKEWLQYCTRVIQEIFHRSNFYDTLPKVYSEMGVFGQGPFSLEEHDDLVIATKQYTVGSYRLGQDRLGNVDTFYRKYPMTVKQVVEQFGEARKSLNGMGASHRVMEMYDRGDYYKSVIVVHAVEPNMGNGFRGLGNVEMPWRSVYLEDGAQNSQTSPILRMSGFERNPVMAPRWENDDDSPYASSCPGMDTLPDVQQLQKAESLKNEGISKMVSPPVKAPHALKNSQVSLLSGHVTFFEPTEDTKFEPIYQVDPRLDHLSAEIQRLEDRIRTGLYADMFLMLYSLRDNPSMTATEVEERHSEKLLLLGPVLERINNQGLDPAIDWTFDLALKRGLFPPPPPEMHGQEIGVEYISVLAQAQRAIGVGNVERFMGFVGGITEGLDPTARHSLDAHKAIERYGEMVGIPADIMRDEEQVAEIMAQEKQEQSQQQAMEQAAVGAKAASDLADAPLEGGGTALDSVVAATGAPV